MCAPEQSLKVLTQSASGGVLPTSSKLKNLARGRWKQAIFKTKIVNKLTSMTDTEKRCALSTVFGGQYIATMTTAFPGIL